jgi:hypothetical protein
LAAEAAEKVGKADPERTKHPTKRNKDASRETRCPLGLKKTKGLWPPSTALRAGFEVVPSYDANRVMTF